MFPSFVKLLKDANDGSEQALLDELCTLDEHLKVHMYCLYYQITCLFRNVDIIYSQCYKNRLSLDAAQLSYKNRLSLGAAQLSQRTEDLAVIKLITDTEF